MSTRRSIGEVVKKKDGAGFGRESLIIKLIHYDLERPPTDYCMLECGDRQCKEWANAQVIIDGKETDDYCYHVSECEMLSLDQDE